MVDEREKWVMVVGFLVVLLMVVRECMEVRFNGVDERERERGGG